MKQISHAEKYRLSTATMEDRYTARGLVTSTLFVVGLLAAMFVPTVLLGAVLGVAGLKLVEWLGRRGRRAFRDDRLTTSTKRRRHAA